MDDSHVQQAAFSVTFASFTLILLSFFIFLDTLAVRDTPKFEQVMRSIQQHFKGGSRALQALRGDEAAPLEILAAELCQADTSCSLDRDAQSLSVPVAVLFVPRDDQIRASAAGALSRFATSARDRQVKAVVENCVRTAVNEQNSAALRAAALFRFFVDQGAGPHGIRSSANFGTQAELQDEEQCRVHLRMPSGGIQRPTVLHAVH